VRVWGTTVDAPKLLYQYPLDAGLEDSTPANMTFSLMIYIAVSSQNPSRVHELVQSFLSSPPGTHISSLCSNTESRNIEPLIEWDEDEGNEGV